MAATDIDGYLAGLDAADREALQRLREQIRQVLPDAEEGISYGIPAFRVDGRVVAGFAAFRSHLSYLPHSGSVLPALGDRLDGYQRTKSSLHFSAADGLPPDLVALLIATKLDELDQ